MIKFVGLDLPPLEFSSFSHESRAKKAHGKRRALNKLKVWTAPILDRSLPTQRKSLPRKWLVKSGHWHPHKLTPFNAGIFARIASSYPCWNTRRIVSIHHRITMDSRNVCSFRLKFRSVCHTDLLQPDWKFYSDQAFERRAPLGIMEGKLIAPWNPPHTSWHYDTERFKGYRPLP